MRWVGFSLDLCRREGLRAARDERAAVLPLTLIILLVLAALVTALLATGAMEPQIAANVLHGGQALGAAEGGAERQIADFYANSGPVDCAMATPADGCATATGTATSYTNVTAGSVGTYTVSYRPISFATLLIESTGTTSVGNTQRRVRVVVTKHYVSKFGVLGNDVEIKGNSKVVGNSGSVHGNSTTEINANSAFVQQVATTTNPDPRECEGCNVQCTNCNPNDQNSSGVGQASASGAGKPYETLPVASPGAIKERATIILGGGELSAPPPYNDAGGTYTPTTCGDPAVTINVFEHEIVNRVTVGGLSACMVTNVKNSNNPRFFTTAGGSQRTEVTGYTNPYGGWNMNGPGQWRTSSGGPDGAYYAFDRTAPVNGGGTASTPWKATFISGGTGEEGRVEIEGNPVIKPFLDDLLAVAGEIKLRGTAVLSGTVIATGTGNDPTKPSDGRIDISGNVQLTGNAISSGRAKVSGNAKINYNVGTRTRLRSPILQILSWSTG